MTLLCLALVSLHIISGLYARYLTTANRDNSARVSKFNGAMIESEQILFPKMEIKSGQHEGTYAFLVTFNVTFENEVASEYILELTIGEDVDISFTCPVNSKYFTVSEEGGAPKEIYTPSEINSAFNGMAFTVNGTYCMVDGCSESPTQNIQAKKATYTYTSLGFNETHNYQILIFTQVSTAAIDKNYTIEYSIKNSQVD